MIGLQFNLETISAALMWMLAVAGPVFGQALKIGEPAPDFAVTSIDGKTSIRLSDFRGRRVLIFNWATW